MGLTVPNLEDQTKEIVDKLDCLTNPTKVATFGGSQDTNTLAGSATTVAITPVASNNVRIVEVYVGVATTVRLDLTLFNGDTLQKTIVGVVNDVVELEINESPIVSISVTELDGTPSRVIINYRSKS